MKTVRFMRTVFFLDICLNSGVSAGDGRYFRKSGTICPWTELFATGGKELPLNKMPTGGKLLP
jgi:hypothetical protein